MVGVASSSRTSSSLTWLKSQNDSPTARNGVGMVAHTTSSTRPANSRQVDSGAAGTAITICAGSASRSACTAANMLAPVASPSSTRMTVLPVTSSGGRPPRYAASRRISSRPSRSAISRSCCGVTRRPRTMSSLMTTRPPLAKAPTANSSCPGAPSLRTTNASSGAPSAAATSQATGMPPRASPSTTTSALPRYAVSRPARTRPASRRSRNSRRGCRVAVAVLRAMMFDPVAVVGAVPGPPAPGPREMVSSCSAP